MKERKKERSENVLTSETMYWLREKKKDEKERKNELSVGDSNPGLSRDRRRYLTNYTNRDFWKQVRRGKIIQRNTIEENNK